MLMAVCYGRPARRPKTNVTVGLAGSVGGQSCAVPASLLTVASVTFGAVLTIKLIRKRFSMNWLRLPRPFEDRGNQRHDK
ncbi:MAG TPA: hypothetical protein VFQ68_17000, partial [Streptosporangiaceae bacterium]|nr:hypothetical protein [Streptosporangiaceae bacterium]